jgi:hypothetical protein
MSIIPVLAEENSEKIFAGVKNDDCNSDETLRLKARSINLLKYNPNLFTNTPEGLYYLLGGHRSLAMTLGCGVVALLYRRNANTLRHLGTREGIWFNTFYFLFGASVGAFYSGVFFLRWQVLFNDYFANFLLKRYKSSKELKRRNIYALKDSPNTDECYHFSESYVNNFHL